MTEVSEDSGWLICIRAQVMCRDESTGGWTAIEGGGVANVMVGRRLSERRLVPPEEGSSRRTSSGPYFEYYIYGKRISDGEEVLSCTIERDFEYNKVMPTFHHWTTSSKRFGLTFQTAADARAFDRGVRTAINEILDGVGGPSYSRPGDMKGQDSDEDNIFECLDLPSGSRSSSETSMESKMKQDDVQTPILSAIKQPEHKDSSVTQFPKSKKEDQSSIEDGEHCSYVHLAAVHEYSYPQFGSISKPPVKQQDSDSIKKLDFTTSPLPLPEKKLRQELLTTSRCRYCHLWYMESSNQPGECDSAPDRFKSCIKTVSCFKCAQCMVYHCMSDSDGGMSNYPCRCVPQDESCLNRWLALSALSLCAPCLCCYLPLMGLRKLCVALGIHKLGKHRACVIENQ